MKRSPIDRSSRLEPGKPPKRKTRLRAHGAVAQREEEAHRRFQRETRARAKGRCEYCGRRGGRMDAHHVVPRGRARGWARLHDAALNGMLVHHFRCHEELTIDPTRAGKRYQRAYAAWRADRNAA